MAYIIQHAIQKLNTFPNIAKEGIKDSARGIWYPQFCVFLFSHQINRFPAVGYRMTYFPEQTPTGPKVPNSDGSVVPYRCTGLVATIISLKSNFQGVIVDIANSLVY